MHFFHELDSPVPNLLQFIQSSTFLILKDFTLGFGGEYGYRDNYVYFFAGPYQLSEECLRVQIRYGHLDSQVASAIQILGTLSPVLSVVDNLTLVYAVNFRSSVCQQYCQ
jgi:hypothetical protein